MQQGIKVKYYGFNIFNRKSEVVLEECLFMPGTPQYDVSVYLLHKGWNKIVIACYNLGMVDYFQRIEPAENPFPIEDESACHQEVSELTRLGASYFAGQNWGLEAYATDCDVKKYDGLNMMGVNRPNGWHLWNGKYRDQREGREWKLLSDKK